MLSSKETGKSMGNCEKMELRQTHRKIQDVPLFKCLNYDCNLLFCEIVEKHFLNDILYIIENQNVHHCCHISNI